MNLIILSSKTAFTSVFSFLVIKLGFLALILTMKLSIASKQIQMRIAVTTSRPPTMNREIFSRLLIMLLQWNADSGDYIY